MENDTQAPMADTQTTTRDTSKHDEYENVANPQAPGSESDDPGQDGRNLRALGSTDMDSQNGLLRQGDQDDSTMEITPEAEKSIANTGTDTEHKPTY